MIVKFAVLLVNKKGSEINSFIPETNKKSGELNRKTPPDPLAA